MTGKVYLVGAGPGDPALLTLKARDVLARAQVVICDSLVGTEILTMIPDTAVAIDAGKRAGGHAVPQEQINEMLVREARTGKTVVRLKGGDPFVFGCGGEELAVLAENGIPFEVVPGVTSAFAVPAYCGIPVTHRDYASSVHVIAGHRKDDDASGIDFEALVRAGGTLVFLMGVSALPQICGGLLAAGMDPSTPAALLERGTTADQRRISASLGDLEEAGRSAGLKAPAVIVVGGVCAAAERLDWTASLPLYGKRILVTRPREMISRMAQMLREQGAEVVEIPAVRSVPFDPPAAMNRALSEASKRGPYDWLVFTSPSGVRIFFELFLQEHDLRELGSTHIAALGRETQRALLERGLRADFMPSEYNTRTLGLELALVMKPNDRVLVARAKGGPDDLIWALEQVPGAQIRDAAIYETVFENFSVIDEKALVEEGRLDAAVFTSVSTVYGFEKATSGADYAKLCAVCIGTQTAEAARALGMQTYVAREATLEALLEKVTEVVGRAAKE